MLKFTLLFFVINLETVLAQDTCTCPGSSVNFLPPGASITITSPDYPETYPDSCNCSYVFGTAQPPPGEIRYFNVNFIRLDLETCCDYVSFFSGNQTSLRGGIIKCSRLSSTCSTTIPIIGPWISMLFHSDSSITKTGFVVTITAMDMSSSTANLSTCFECRQSDWVIDTNKQIQLPSGFFGPKCTCSWKIVVPKGNEITFQSFGVFLGPLDSFKVTDLITNQMTVNCNSNAGCDQDQFAIENYRATVELTSIMGVLNLDPIEVGADILPSPTLNSEHCFCPGSPVVFLPNSGSSISITSPNYPQTYPNNCNCSYEIGTVNNHAFNVIFTNLDLEAKYDYVAFMLGNGTNPANKIKYCDGQEHFCPPFTIKNSNWFTLLFNSDNSAYFSGFSVTITVI